MTNTTQTRVEDIKIWIIWYILYTYLGRGVMYNLFLESQSVCFHRNSSSTFSKKKTQIMQKWIYLTTRGGKHLISWFWHRAEPPRYLDMRNSQREERLSSNFWGKVEDYFGRCFTQLLTASFEFYENAVLQFCCAAAAASSSRTSNWLSHCIPV